MTANKQNKIEKNNICDNIVLFCAGTINEGRLAQLANTDDSRFE